MADPRGESNRYGSSRTSRADNSSSASAQGAQYQGNDGGGQAYARQRQANRINNGIAAPISPEQAMVNSQDFRPKMPDNPLSLLLGGPASPFIRSFLD